MTGTEPIRIGMLGLGRAGWGMHCEELESRKEKLQIVAVWDALPDRLAQAEARYGCRTYRDLGDLLHDPDVELVDVATRSVDHVVHASAALEAGKTVFLEKPMAITYRQARGLQELAARSAGELYVRHNRRFEPAFQHIREIIAGGILGDVYEIKLRRVSYSRRDDWQTILRFGGGQLLNWGPHIIDHALCFLESPVADMWSSLQRVAAVGDAEDHIKIVLTGANGRVVDLEISGGAAIEEPEYLIWGSRGALRCTGDQIELRYLDPSAGLDAREADPGTPQADFGTPEELPWVEQTITASPALAVDTDSVWDALYAAIRLGEPYPITLDQAVEVMQIVDRAREGTPFVIPTEE